MNPAKRNVLDLKKRNVQKSGKTKRSKNFAHTTL